jgi:large subunit ribosomal protein L18
MKTIRRRRREAKTDYLKRKNLLKNNAPRLVLRRTNKYLICQYVKSREAQDMVIFGVTSKALVKYGWPIDKLKNIKSVSAAYLLGYLVGKKINKDNIQKPIVDFGMYRTIHKNRLFSFLKGLKDSGIEVKVEEKTFPEEDRINKIQGLPFEKIKSNIDKK